MVDFLTLARQCAPDVHPATLTALVRTESGFNPYAIGVVSGRLERQPATLDEAVVTAQQLQRDGFNASFGLGQINLRNLARFRLDLRSVFDPCQNLRASAAILSEAYARARQTEPDEQKALRAALSMYYSGNPVTGVQHGYVAKVVGNAGVRDAVTSTRPAMPITVIRNSSPMASSKLGPGSASAPVSSAMLTASATDAASARPKNAPSSASFKPKPMW